MPLRVLRSIGLEGVNCPDLGPLQKHGPALRYRVTDVNEHRSGTGTGGNVFQSKSTSKMSRSSRPLGRRGHRKLLGHDRRVDRTAHHTSGRNHT